MTLVFSCTVKLTTLRNSAKVLKWPLSGRMLPCSLLMTVNHVLRRNFSFENIYLSKNERRVCVIYTGGTIGMVRSPCGGMIISYILPFALFGWSWTCEMDSISRNGIGRGCKSSKLMSCHCCYAIRTHLWKENVRKECSKVSSFARC
jgi:hypothetical protein